MYKVTFLTQTFDVLTEYYQTAEQAFAVAQARNYRILHVVEQADAA